MGVQKFIQIIVGHFTLVFILYGASPVKAANKCGVFFNQVEVLGDFSDENWLLQYGETVEDVFSVHAGATFKKALSEMTLSELRSFAMGRGQTSVAEIKAIASLQKYWGAQLPQGKYLEPWLENMRLIAGRISTRVSAINSNHITPQEFLMEQAELSRAQYEENKNVYRLDDRSPDVLRRDGGFIPNPEKPIGGIHDHAIVDSLGTRNFVSTTTVESPTALVMVNLIEPQKLPLTFSISDQSLLADFIKDPKEFVSQNVKSDRVGIVYKGRRTVPTREHVEYLDRVKKNFPNTWKEQLAPFWDEGKSVSETSVIYEYGIKGVEGITVPEGAGATVKEFLTLSIPVNKIDRWRPVFIFKTEARKYTPEVVLFGDWRSF